MKKYLLFLIIIIVGILSFTSDVLAATKCTDIKLQGNCEEMGCVWSSTICFDKRTAYCTKATNESDCYNKRDCCFFNSGYCFPLQNASSCSYPINQPTAPLGGCTTITDVRFINVKDFCEMRSDCAWDSSLFSGRCVTKSTSSTSSISQAADLSGVSFNNPVVSGTFKAGVQIVNNVCSIFDFTSVTYKIDNDSEKSLSCWTKTSSGSCTGGGGGDDPDPKPAPADTDFLMRGFFDNFIGFLKNNLFVSAQTTCSNCTVSQYQFNSNCSIGTSGLSAGSHVLTIIFKTNSSVKSSYTKTFNFSTGSSSECLSSKNNPSGSNDDCIAKYGIGSGKICCHDNVCSKCGSGPKPSSTPTPTPTPPPSALVLDLSSVFSGQNITKSTKAGSKITGNPGDLIKFSVKVTSTGKNEVKNTLVKATLPNKLIFQDGSLNVDGQKMSGDFFGRGLDIGTLGAGQSKTVSFEARVATQSQFASGSQESLSTSIAVQGVGVAIKTSSVSLTVGAGKIVSEMSLDMNARNITKGTSLTRNLEANPGDTVEFRLVAIATGDGPALGVKIADVLPTAFEYISGSTKIDGSFATDGVVGKGISLGDLERNNSRVIVFSAKVSESYEYSIGENYFQNIGKLSASNVSLSTDYLDVKVVREAISDSKLAVGVRLVTNSQFFYARSIAANPGQQVEFAVKITAMGEGDLNNVVLKNIFPSRLTYVKGSTSIDNQKVDDSIITGLNVGNIPLGSYKIVTFHGLISGYSSFNYGTTPLVNQISMTASGVDVTVRDVTVNVNRYKPQPSPSPSLELMAYNETQGQDATTVFAKPADIIWLVMIATNNYESAINSYEIKNDISNLLKVGSVTSLGGGTVTDGLLIYPAVNIPASNIISKELKIKINNADKWNDILQISNTFGNTVIINLEKPIIIPEPKIEVSKRIINTTWVNGTETEVEARPNDQLEFIMEVTNTSSVMVGDVKVVENLPAKLTYVSGDENASYNSLTGEVLWELGALIPGERKEIRLLASVSSDAFIPSEFAMTARAEAFNGISSLSLDSNEVKAGIKSFTNPYSLWIKIIGGVVALILLVIFGYILYKRVIKKRDTNEYLPLGKN